MPNTLPCLLPDIGNYSVAFHSKLFGQLGDHRQHMAGDSAVAVINFGNRRNMSFGNHQKMSGRLTTDSKPYFSLFLRRCYIGFNFGWVFPPSMRYAFLRHLFLHQCAEFDNPSKAEHLLKCFFYFPRFSTRAFQTEAKHRAMVYARLLNSSLVGNSMVSLIVCPPFI